MREIIHLQLGRCGNCIGSNFWDLISNEHGLKRDICFPGSLNESECINVYFEEGADNKYKARAILVDPDFSKLCRISENPLFKKNNIVSGVSGTNYNWARGYYSEGAECLEQTIDAVRREAEASDCMQGIQIVHSLGGGTGAGLGSLLVKCLIDEYPDNILRSYGILPMRLQQRQQYITTSYNAILTIPYLINCAHEVVCMDDKFVTNLFATRLLCDYDEMYYYMSLCMAGTTVCLRCPCQYNTDLRKFHANMVPFQRMHFFVPGHAPLIPANLRCKCQSERIKIQELLRSVFDSKNMFVEHNSETGKYITAAVIIKGPESSKNVDEKILTIQDSLCFVNWIPKNIHIDICRSLSHNTRTSVTSLLNTTAIRKPFERLSNRFRKMFQEKEFIHLYTQEGMEESEFQEAHETVLSLISEYQQHDNAMAETDFVEEPED